MVRHGHSESLSGIDVSSRVVVTLGVFLLSRRDRGGGEEEKESGAERPEMLLL